MIRDAVGWESLISRAPLEKLPRRLAQPLRSANWRHRQSLPDQIPDIYIDFFQLSAARHVRSGWARARASRASCRQIVRAALNQGKQPLR
jgi:hypothetical protein